MPLSSWVFFSWPLISYPRIFCPPLFSLLFWPCLWIGLLTLLPYLSVDRYYLVSEGGWWSVVGGRWSELGGFDGLNMMITMEIYL